MDVGVILEEWSGLQLLNVWDTKISCTSKHEYHHKTEIICLQELPHFSQTRAEFTTSSMSVTSLKSLTSRAEFVTSSMSVTSLKSVTSLGSTVGTLPASVGVDDSVTELSSTNTTLKQLGSNFTTFDGNTIGTQSWYYYNKSSFIAITTIAVILSVIVVTFGSMGIYICVRRRIREQNYEIDSPIYVGLGMEMEDLEGVDLDADL
jgi:hypothetical protein